MKHKRLLSSVLAVALFAALGTGIYAVEPADVNTSEAIDIGFGPGVVGGAWEDTPSLTQHDLDTNCQDYAQDSSKVSFPQKGFALFPRELPGGSAVGVVLDLVTDAPLAGATIEVDGTPIVATDEDGRFQINHMPDGFYDWTISVDGYKTGHYSNYDVNECNGATILTFYLSQDFEFIRDHRDYMTHNQQVPPPEAFENSPEVFL